MKADVTPLPSEAGAGSVSSIESRSVRRRYLEAAGFVAVWMLIGVAMRLTGMSNDNFTNGYLLAGIPLMLIFQKFVRRQPLETVWVRAGRNESGKMGFVRILAGFILAAFPASGLVEMYRSGSIQLIPALWLVAALLGAFAAAFTLHNTSNLAFQNGGPSFLGAVAAGMMIVATTAIINGKSILPYERAIEFGGQFLTYFAVCFSIEEVVFRGMLDSHVQPVPATGRSAWFSAIIVSWIWGLWHLPIAEVTDAGSFAVIAVWFSIAHIAIGIPLSFCWRSSGTLLLPAAAHALIDAYRNVVLF